MRVDIENFPGYQIDERGNVWSCRNNHGLSSRWKQRKLSCDQYGYVCVKLARNGRMINKRVHTLVMRAFIGPCPKGMQICHEDGNPLNCELSNLRYDTPVNNCKDTIRHGRTTTGTKNSHAKLNEKDILTILSRAKSGEKAIKIATDFGIHAQHCRAIIRGVFWKCLQLN